MYITYIIDIYYIYNYYMSFMLMIFVTDKKDDCTVFREPVRTIRSFFRINGSKGFNTGAYPQQFFMK